MRCPTCRRTITETAVNTACPRCDTDLSELLHLEKTCQCLIARGRQALHTADADTAATCFRQAYELDPQRFEIQQGMAMTALLRRDFPTALRWYTRCTN